jgi:hypothetical protein
VALGQPVYRVWLVQLVPLAAPVRSALVLPVLWAAPVRPALLVPLVLLALVPPVRRAPRARLGQPVRQGSQEPRGLGLLVRLESLVAQVQVRLVPPGSPVLVPPARPVIPGARVRPA